MAVIQLSHAQDRTRCSRSVWLARTSDPRLGKGTMLRQHGLSYIPAENDVIWPFGHEPPEQRKLGRAEIRASSTIAAA
jgi:hypothetical protein